MRHDHQIFTVFGGSYVAERRDNPTAASHREHHFAPLAALLTAALLGATIPAVAFTASSHLKAVEAAKWQRPQQHPSYFIRVPASVGFDQAVF